MKKNRTFIVIIVVLFFVGLMIGNFSNDNYMDYPVINLEDDEIEEPGNDYNKRIAIEYTRNLFVRIAKILENIINRGINILVNLIQRLFSMIFGT